MVGAEAFQDMEQTVNWHLEEVDHLVEGELELEDILQEEDKDWFTKLLLHFVFNQKDFII